ncbi:sugar ABC transporter ATP-binding protein [Metabacillus litoralis]|uniref:sugar ABC transporter ATP-binding protein n=1 Tax=Metabacillus litoralis TaxID=152268 RepID=UPI000EF627F2|nr:sugar ABC transporter ATP-binding protein [Metabacillus litoralis]MCM3161437.1 sugar ABC transporter ATP-binding protein [Metabacillus litoralis]
MPKPLVEMKQIVKKFKGTAALKGVDLEIQPGEIHALLGENGAGKSTLIKILTGAYIPDEGEIIVKNQSFKAIPVKELEKLGIAVVYQDLKLAPGVSIAENIYMGKLPKRFGVFVNKRRAREQTKVALDRVGIGDTDPDTKVGDLKIAEQEIVAIAKAISKDAKLLILDEPTALLAEDDVKKLFRILKELVAQGVSIIYISHRLEEIFEISDRITVLRDGNKIWTKSVSEVQSDMLIEAIAGEMQGNDQVYDQIQIGKELLRIEQLTNFPHYKNISFSIHRGEVVGLFGLVGAGKSELLKGIYGAIPPHSGNIHINGLPFTPKHPRDSIKNKIGFVAEDRGTEGFLPRISIYKNVNIASYKHAATLGFITASTEKKRALEMIQSFNVKYSNLDQNIDDLSGGNQQKIVVAKWKGTDIEILLLDEPTAGIDVGARRDIYKVSRLLAKEGKCVLYSSSYLPELLEVCDRILVLSEGEITGEFSRLNDFNERNIMKAAYA